LSSVKRVASVTSEKAFDWRVENKITNVCRSLSVFLKKTVPMFLRSAVTFIFILSGSLYLAACSCFNVHTPLEDVICHADTSGGLVLELEMTIRIDNNNQARFRIAEVHVGSTDLEEVNLAGFTSCAWYMRDEDQPGRRFLYITHPDWIRDGEGDLFGCGLNSNIYRMNNRGTRVEYPVGVDGRNTRMAYRNLPGSGCSVAGIKVNPLRSLLLTNNPGSGVMRIINSTQEVPRITSIDILNGAGQIIEHSEPGLSALTTPIDIQRMPTGVYFVVVRQGIHVKTLRYVKR